MAITVTTPDEAALALRGRRRLPLPARVRGGRASRQPSPTGTVPIRTTRSSELLSRVRGRDRRAPDRRRGHRRSRRRGRPCWRPEPCRRKRARPFSVAPRAGPTHLPGAPSPIPVHLAPPSPAPSAADGPAAWSTAFMRAHRARPAAYPEINNATRPLRAAAAASGDSDHMSLYAGVNFRRAEARPAGEIVASGWCRDGAVSSRRDVQTFEFRPPDNDRVAGLLRLVRRPARAGSTSCPAWRPTRPRARPCPPGSSPFSATVRPR